MPGDGILDTFRVVDLGPGPNPFPELLASVRFEPVTKGRTGTVIVSTTRGHAHGHSPPRHTPVGAAGARDAAAAADGGGAASSPPQDPDQGLEGAGASAAAAADDEWVPIVRTTTRYEAPAQRFQPVHAALAAAVTDRVPQGFANVAARLNNALIELYENAYAKMGFHSDQALDLEPESFIAVFSCYERPEHANRKLVIEAKEGAAGGGGGRREILLAHNAAVVFTVAGNARYRHKIVLDGDPKRAAPNRWLGVTMRSSRTWVHVRPGTDGESVDGRFADGAALTLATPAERQEFYQLRGRENREVGFEYPPLRFTISPCDLMPPVEHQ